ncbi:MAG: tRNA pseudouridine(38-40) synthase TruA [Sneathiella sp.]|jgi:tRNA pseudouridine38-40 synthase|uniref:tRNA pseudouridine(38-40) synthase TruA n=1 Tax=Sneathiella sp. TaxID=1964365 RepID=UPI000C350432|nr:tRNA pseudouridine(38-40) synthase TruA [Sneathiella sp.]MAL78880.1 tRNA pseudouridine(38-40) synthase TruA [Sneathiella sp.]
MPFYRVTIEYDGRALVGWQRQKNGPSVQQHIEEAIFAFCGEEVRIQGAGRTDAGVHALGQVANFALASYRKPEVVMNALNFHLKPAPVAILDCVEVDEDFSARFSATRRHYLYRIINRRAPLTVDAGLAWHVKRDLDTAAMARAASVLVGQHDFTTFRAAACQANSPLRTLDKLEVSRAGELIEVRTSAQSFLHNQVRAMVGSLSLVGTGQWTAGDLQAALEARDRQRAGPNAPPYGLYLTQVDYS